MRWEQLFADLEAQLAAAEDADFDVEVADRVRSEVARLAVADRLRAARGLPLRLDLLGGTAVSGVLAVIGPDWLLVYEYSGGEALVLLSALAAVRGLPRIGAQPATRGRVAARIGLAHSLRQLARDRLPVVLTLVDGTSVAGTVDRVGADHVEVAEHPGADVRRSREVSSLRLVPTAVLACVRRRDQGASAADRV